jgi:hypothetical protein
MLPTANINFYINLNMHTSLKLEKKPIRPNNKNKKNINFSWDCPFHACFAVLFH